jgi:transcription antitermination factor NusG
VGPARRPSAEQRAEIEQQLFTRGLLQDVSESELIKLHRRVRPKHFPEDLNKEAREAQEKNGPWMIARTKPHREYEAKKALKEAGFEVYLPKLKLIVGRKRRKTLQRKRPGRKRPNYLYLFPRYLFVRLTEKWKPVLECKWISVIIRCPGLVAEPATMKDKEIKEWKAREQGGFICLKGYMEGQKVRAKAGPYAGQIGTFIELVGEDREFASFYILGQERRVEFSPDVLEAVI